MLTLYHAPRSRSTRIVALIEDLGAQDKVTIDPVSVPRQDGSGSRDARNPHPEGKVPLLVHGEAVIWESTAIALYLTELFPDAGLGRPIGAPDRGVLLSWLAWYGDVLEPVIVMEFAEIRHPVVQSTFRGMAEVTDRLSHALKDRPYLLGDDYSVADAICSSAFQFAAGFTPDVPHIQDWVARCGDRPALKNAIAFDTRLIETAGAH